MGGVPQEDVEHEDRKDRDGFDELSLDRRDDHRDEQDDDDEGAAGRAQAARLEKLKVEAMERFVAIGSWFEKMKLAYEKEGYNSRNYVKAQEAVATKYVDQQAWWRSSVINVARMGFFSSDRTIREYADDIWDLKSVPPTANG